MKAVIAKLGEENDQLKKTKNPEQENNSASLQNQAAGRSSIDSIKLKKRLEEIKDCAGKKNDPVKNFQDSFSQTEIGVEIQANHSLVNNYSQELGNELLQIASNISYKPDFQIEKKYKEEEMKFST